MAVRFICAERGGTARIEKPGRCEQHAKERAKRDYRRNKLNPQWRARQRIYTSRRWRTVTRPAALERAGYRCERCGAVGVLDVCHTVPTTALVGTDAAYDLGLVIVLCRVCHNRYGAPHRLPA